MPYDLPPPADPTVIELRQYTLHPRRRDDLIDLFERYFVDGQEAAGIHVYGQFRDADDANRFVWLRGFADMPARAQALESFYGGPIWQAHRTAANATMVDSDNVLLLRPLEASDRLAPADAALVVATVYLLAEPVSADFVRFFDSHVRPIVTESGAPPIARLTTEYAPNNFPALPVRTGEHAFVWIASFATTAAYESYVARLKAEKAWSDTQAALSQRLASPPQLLHLLPTARSKLGHGVASGGVHDFDFLAGTWKVLNRRLVARGGGSHEWEEFPGTSTASLHLGGVANVDEIQFPTKGWAGMTVRAFDLQSRQWSIHWISSKQGRLMPPVRGRFEGDRGTFLGDDMDDGRNVKVRFYWTRRGADAARWEQAFSYDDGKSWETNWVMDFLRDGGRP